MNHHEIIRKMLINQANEDMSKWPQYEGHFDDYQLIRVTKNVKTKLGTAFHKGDLAIGKWHNGMNAYVAYSLTNKCDTSLPSKCVEVVR